MSIAAQGTVLSIESVTPGNYTAIGEVTSISGPTVSRTVLNPTSLSDSYQRKAVGLIDYGTITAELHLNYGDAGQDRVRTQLAAGARALWRLVIPAGQLGSGSASTQTTHSFAGFATGWTLNGQMDGLYRATLTITLDADPVES